MKHNTGSINWRRIVPICRKEFLHILRDRRSLGIVFLAPLVLLVLYGYAVTFDIRMIDLGVIDRDQSALSRNLIQRFSSSGYFEVFDPTVPGDEAVYRALRTNRVRLVVTVPPGFESDIKRSRPVKVQVVADGSDANTANVALGYARMITGQFGRDVLLDTVRRRGFNPKEMPAVEAVPRVWYNPDLKSTNFIVPGLIAIIMMLMAGLLTSLTIVREKDRGTYEQLISTPVKPVELIAGKLIPYILIGLCDLCIIVVAAVVWFHVPFRGDVLTLFIFSLLFIFCALGLGLFMSSVVASQQVAVIATLLVTVLPSVLLSGFVFPIESMPWVIRIVTYVVPARYFLTALRAIFLKADVGLAQLSGEMLFLILFGVIFLGVATWRFRKTLE